MWQRWNQSTHIFEKSDDDGVSWVPLPLNASVLTEGTLDQGRLTNWTSYTPTWISNSSPQPSLGNGSLGGRYMRKGKTVWFQMFLNIGSSTTLGTGSWTFSLPTTAQFVFGFENMPVRMLQAGVAYFFGAASLVTSTTFLINLSGTLAPASPTTPFAWSVGSQMFINGMYDEP